MKTQKQINEEVDYLKKKFSAIGESKGSPTLKKPNDVNWIKVHEDRAYDNGKLDGQESVLVRVRETKDKIIKRLELASENYQSKKDLESFRIRQIYDLIIDDVEREFRWAKEKEVSH